MKSDLMLQPRKDTDTDTRGCVGLCVLNFPASDGRESFKVSTWPLVSALGSPTLDPEW
ncbi:hypothetical protein AALO_G00176680 [Alosa alosa]|uniref:Uncharacterized protein n=1 Tax=Alosa alosa TaxID=278164 RepID=A0AAV6GCC6_9TELE|nr:hypothetical protein AALO_G00176680 [Alosa alosa]